MITKKKNKLIPAFITLTTIFSSILLLIYTYQDYSIQDLKEGLQHARFKWIFFAMGAHLINHSLRAYRWRFLLKKQNNDVTWTQTFTAEMSGFFANALGLRIGEIVRCQRLRKMQNIPIKQSFATVIIERVTDIIFFFAMYAIITLLFFAKIKTITLHLLKNVTMEERTWSMKQIIAFIAIILPVAIWIYQQVKKQIHLFIKQTIQHIKLGYKANTSFFWGITCCIWIFYFLLEYVSLYALDSTGQLAQKEGIFAGIVVFIILNVSHIIPVSNGLGLYHALIVSALTYFNIPIKDAQTYAVITHGIQTFNAFYWGGVCLINTIFTPAKKQDNPTLNPKKE